MAGAGLIASMVGGKAGSIVGTGVLVDGAEDILRGVFGLSGGSGGSATLGGSDTNLNEQIGAPI